MLGLVVDDGLHLCEVEEPRPDPCDALIRVSRVGVCGTDLQLARGYADYSGIIGHEFVGVVDECESAPQWEGRRVVGEINITCGHCRRCRQGMSTHCTRRTVAGIRGRAGAFAPWLTLPVANLHEVPANVEDEVAVLAEPIAAAFRILEQVELDEHTEVAVWGDGKLGLAIAMVLATTDCRLTVVGRHPHKLKIAKALGARVRTTQDTLRSDFDVIVEATGSPLGLATAMNHVRPLGTLVLKSTVAEPNRVDTSALVVNEIRVLGSRCGPFEPALEALATGAIDPSPLIEMTYPLTQGLAAFEHAARSGTLKILVAPT